MKAQQAPGHGQLALVGRLKAPRESTLPEGARVWVTVLGHEPWAGSFSPGEERQDRAAELGAGPGCERGPHPARPALQQPRRHKDCHSEPTLPGGGRLQGWKEISERAN